MKISWIQQQWFSRQPTILGGLALGDDAWRWVRGDHFDQEPLQPGWVVNGVVVAIEPVSAALKRLWARLEIGPNPPPLQVAMNLPSTAVLLHRVKVPCRLSDQKLLAFCRQHAGDWLPLPLADMVLDVYVDGDSEGVGDEESQWAWVAATRLERVEQARLLAEAAGLTLCILETESCAYRRAVFRHWPNGKNKPELGQCLALCLLAEETTQVQFFRWELSGPVLQEERSLAWGRRHWVTPRLDQENQSWLLPEVLEAVLSGFLTHQGIAKNAGTAVLPVWAVIFLGGRLPPWLQEPATDAGGAWSAGLSVCIFDPFPRSEVLESPAFSVAFGLSQPVGLFPAPSA